MIVVGRYVSLEENLYEDPRSETVLMMRGKEVLDYAALLIPPKMGKDRVQGDCMSMALFDIVSCTTSFLRLGK